MHVYSRPQSNWLRIVNIFVFIKFETLHLVSVCTHYVSCMRKNIGYWQTILGASINHVDNDLPNFSRKSTWMGRGIIGWSTWPGGRDKTVQKSFHIVYGCPQHCNWEYISVNWAISINIMVMPTWIWVYFWFKLWLKSNLGAERAWNN